MQASVTTYVIESGSSLTKSLRASAAAVNCQLFIAEPRLRRRAAPFGQFKHAEHAHLAAQRKRNHASDADLLGRFFDPATIDADMALLDHALGDGPAFDEPDAVQIAVDPQPYPRGRLSLASSAKAWDPAALRSSRGG